MPQMKDLYYGANAILHGQLYDSGDVPAVLASTRLRFSTIRIGRKAVRPEDPTINDDVLPEVETEQDESPTASIKAIASLNDMGFWLTALLGEPVTTGTGPYTHTFTLTRGLRPEALLELVEQGVNDSFFRRFKGMYVNSIEMDMLNTEQSITIELVGRAEVMDRDWETSHG
jgi:hypothetical protein